MTRSPAKALGHLLDVRHLARAEDLPGLLQKIAPLVGAKTLTVFVIDYSQRELAPLHDPATEARRAVQVDSTLAGRAFRDARAQHGNNTSWIPVLDGTERLGVLQVVWDGAHTENDVRWCTRLATLVAEFLVSHDEYGDLITRSRRRMPMSLSAEIQWGLLPPLTCATPRWVISGILEPCYDIGGDSFDYAVNGDLLQVAVLDAMGHGMGAAQLAALALSAYRNARRCGLDLADTYTSMDRWISSQFPGRFVTGVLGELDSSNGRFRYISAGHPPGMVFRQGQFVRSLQGPTALPMGLGTTGQVGAAGTTLATETLEPRDRVLLYTDGLVEARSDEGSEFGVDRLTDFMRRQLASDLSPAETMRRLIHTILDYQADSLQDDASAVLLEWCGPADGLEF